MENNLESYCAAIEAQLGEMPAARKSAALDEVRAHLWAMFEARRTDGLDAKAAWRRAAVEFGEPEKVGRALWKQWVSSGQMEDEGAPITRRDTAYKWAFAVSFGVIFVLLLVLEHMSIFEACAWLLVVLPFLEMRSYSPYNRGKWSFTGLFLCALPAFSVLDLLFINLWQGTSRGEILNYATIVVALTYLPIYLYYRKHETAQRPWKDDYLFSRSPIAAEQKYRMEPRIILTMIAIFGCTFVLAQGLGSLSWPSLVLTCAAIIAFAFTVHRWVSR